MPEKGIDGQRTPVKGIPLGPRPPALLLRETLCVVTPSKPGNPGFVRLTLIILVKNYQSIDSGFFI